MKSRVLISPNSFKECADAVTIAKIIKKDLVQLKDVEPIVKPITDGGDGFLNVCQFYFGGEIRYYPISKPYDETLFDCPVLYCEDREEVYIESAEVLGLRKVPTIYRNPLKLSSKGLGEILLNLEEDLRQQKIQAKKVFIGIGGTATIDMGMGMMSKLGLSLYDSLGKSLDVLPGNFQFVNKFQFEPIDFPFEIIPVLDVVNALFGEQGGIRVFGEQKNASQEDILYLEKSFNKIVNLFIYNNLSISSDTLFGAGGGIPAALQIFLNCKTISSNEFIFEKLDFRNNLQGFDYLIIGEGAYDSQSGFGKGAGLIISRFSPIVKKTFLICGKITERSKTELPANVVPFSILDYYKNEQESILNYQKGIDKICLEIIKQIDF